MARKVQVVDVTEEPNYEVLVRELEQVQKQKAILEKRDKEIKAVMTSKYFSSASTDNRGHSFYETTFLDGSPAILKREARTSVKINYDKALAFFSAKNLINQVAEKIWSFNEDAIEQLLANEEITMEELESICDKSTTYAIKFIKAKEEEEV
jgi:hypothetical protein